MKWTDGVTIAPLIKPTITREQLSAYAEASLDKNPIHLDEKFAKEAGFPSVIAHGMLSMAFLGDLVRHNFPEKTYRLLTMSTRFRKVTFPGDTPNCQGKIKKVEADGTLVVSVWIENQKGEVTTEGEARVRTL
jgi:acyl dehydratase